MGTLDDILSRLQALPPEQRAEAERAATALGHLRWVPNPGPQMDAFLSPADVLLYGGEPGGGKSDLLLGLAFTQHRRSLLMRRQYTDLGFLTERAIQINGGRDGYSGSPPPKLRIDGRAIDFGAAQNVGSEQHWMGNPHDLLGIDEATQFARTQVDLLMGWVRTEAEGQRCRVVFATNPPLTAEGLWINEMFAPWIDDRYPDPARPGELRWVIRDENDRDKWVPGPGMYAVGDRMVKAQSRTYIPAAVADNPQYARSDYQAKLDAMPESYRNILLGHFRTTIKDQDFQVIPTDWIRAAQQRWRPEPPNGIPMCAIGVDASGGGQDPLVLAPRYDGWYAPLISVPGETLPMDKLGAHQAGLVISHRRDKALVIVDLGGGYGGSMLEHLVANAVETQGYKGAEGTARRTADKRLTFTNVRSAAYWQFREALDPGQPGGSPIALPNDPVLVADLTAPTFTVTPNGIKLEAKEAIMERIGRSTDHGDAVVMAWWAGPKDTSHALEWADQRERRNRPKVVMGRRR